MTTHRADLPTNSDCPTAKLSSLDFTRWQALLYGNGAYLRVHGGRRLHTVWPTIADTCGVAMIDGHLHWIAQAIKEHRP